MMSYRQNRVEYIKKKFETSFSGENETLPSKPIFFKAEVFQDDGSIDKIMVQKKPVAAIEMTNAKSLVRRTPAFRREKMKSREVKVNNLTPSKGNEICNSSCGKEIDSRNSEHIKTADTGVLVNNDLKKIHNSKTEINLHKFNDKSNAVNSNLFSSEHNLLDITKDDKNRENKKQLAQCQAVEGDVEVINVEEKKVLDLDFSESIRKALESPLPKGPPPKKPPRTFCYKAQTSNENSCVKSKTLSTGISVLKSKLEKLENVIKVHELGSYNSNHKQNYEWNLSTKPSENPLRKKIALKVPNKKNENLSSCLQLSNCLSQCVNEKLATEINENCLGTTQFNSQLSDHVVNEMKKIAINEIKKEDVYLKAKNLEPIYDVPCINKKNEFKTFGKHNDESQTNLESQEMDGLHYMCIDVVNSTSKSSYTSTLNPTKSLDNEKWAESFFLKSKFSNDSLKRVSSKIEKDEEQIIKPLKNLIEQKNDHNQNVEEEIETLKSTAFYYGSKETGGCLIPSMFDREPGSKFSTEKDLNKNESEKKPKTLKIESLSGMTVRTEVKVDEFSSTVNDENLNDEYIHSGSSHLFESCLVVGLTLCESKKNVPYIKSVFPPDVKPPPLIESLCFPDASYWPFTSESHQPEEQYYSLVLTNQNGSRKFGYCRRVLPEGGHYCLPLTYCIISPHRANGFYYKVLQELESRHGSPGIEDFIQRLYNCQFPGPGGRLKLMEIFENATQLTPSKKDEYWSTTLVRRPCDIRLEEKDLAQLLSYLQISVLLKVFSSLLRERKILLLSNSLGKLSTCSEALHSILLPFSWKHTSIPVLPVHLIEMCDAPTPYVMGLLKHKNFEQLMANINFEDGIVVDLDNSKIIRCCGDEENILPQKLVKDLKISLNMAVISTNLSDTNRNVLISDAFIRFFVQVCGNFSKFIIKLSNGKKIFECLIRNELRIKHNLLEQCVNLPLRKPTEIFQLVFIAMSEIKILIATLNLNMFVKGEFIKSFSSDSTQAFLEWFTETSMFTSFIQEILHKNAEDIPVRLFRLRATEYSENIKNPTVLQKNCKVINRRVRILGDKIKDLTSFTK